jgi:hypothetical protein
MNINPLQLIQLIKGGQNPQQLLMSIMQNNNNPILQNAMEMVKQGNASGLELLARNIAQQKGIYFDKAFSEFQGYLK